MEKKNQRSILPALLVGAFFLYLYIQLLSFNQGSIANPITGGMYFILFGVHEASHIVFGFLPAVFVAAVGSLSELLFAFLLVIAAIRAKSSIAISFSLLWCMLAMSSAGRYMADAKYQLMPLIGPGASVRHDWNYVFTELDLLTYSELIGDTLRYGGYMVGAIGVICIFWYVIKRFLTT